MPELTATTRLFGRVALLSAPLLAVFRVSPLFILTSSGAELPVFVAQTGPMAALLIFGLTVVILLQWSLNVYLFHLRRKGENTEAWNYLYSYAFCLFLVLLPLPVRMWLTEGELPIIVFPAILYPLLGTVANNTIIIFIINLVRGRDREARLELVNMQLMVDGMRSRQEQLKQQLQPHFLFNALYNLQLLIDAEPGRARRYVGKLSNLLRSSLDNVGKGCLTTGEEVAFTRDYLDLQKLRFGEALTYEIDVEEGLFTQSMLPVFSLQLLTENAIKHNRFSRRDPLRIRIEDTGDNRLRISNNSGGADKSAPSPGKGLNNLRDRFSLYTRAPIAVAATAGSFSVTIPLLRYEHHHH